MWGKHLSFLVVTALVSPPLEAYFNLGNVGNLNTNNNVLGGCGCHGGGKVINPATTIAFLDSQGAAATRWEPGQTYQVRINLDPLNAPLVTTANGTIYRMGFRLVVTDGGGTTNMGTLVNQIPVSAQMAVSTYNPNLGSIAANLETATPNVLSSLVINWTAPMEQRGDAVFKIGIVQGNGGGATGAPDQGGDTGSGSYTNFTLSGPRADAGAPATKKTGTGTTTTTEEESTDFSGNFSGGCGVLNFQPEFARTSLMGLGLSLLLIFGFGLGLRRRVSRLKAKRL